MRWWRHAWPGFLATLVSVGLGRFGYTSLVPFLIGGGELTPTSAAYLGAANFAGYFIGAALAARLARRFGMTRILRLALILTTVGLAACIPPWGFWWYLPWRVLVGVTGALLMVLSAGFLFAGTPGPARGRIGGIVYTGVGAGIALAGLTLAPLARIGLTWTMGVLALIAAAVTFATWGRWRGGGVVPDVTRIRLPFSPPTLLTILAFATDGAGYAAHALFWVDFIARELGRGPAIASVNWLLFGLAATLGPSLAGAVGDAIGLGRALALALAVKSLGVLLPVLTTTPLALAVSSIVVGGLSPALPALASARFTQLVPAGELTRTWGIATLAVACFQASAGYAMSYEVSRHDTYVPLFVACSLVLVVGAAAAATALILAPKPITT